LPYALCPPWNSDDLNGPPLHSAGVYKPAELWQAKEHHPPPKKRSCTMVFTLKEMEEATNMFSDRNLVGKGGFGRVYRGVLKDGQVLACLLFTNPSLHPSFFVAAGSFSDAR